jgi:indolepyruvate ferredoxin oxidoreductase
VRIAAGEADAVLGCDMVVTASDEAIAKMQAGKTRAVVNSSVSTTGEFTNSPDLHVPVKEMQESIVDATGAGAAEFIDATGLATALMGDAIYTNPFVMGYAFQKGLVPLSGESILAAIELNGTAADRNKAAFDWGRRAAVDLRAVQRTAIPPESKPESHRLSESLDELIARRESFLADYQDAAYARRYSAFVARARAAEAARVPGSKELTAAVARYLFKLMAYKDEYEVARLYTQGDFLKRVNEQFEGDFRLVYHLAPPILSKFDPATGEPKKRAFGPWMLPAFRVLAKLKGLRGTALDIFGYSRERRMERQLIADYERTVAGLLDSLAAGNIAIAADIAAIPEYIRGYGPVKDAHLKDAKAREAELLAIYTNPQPGAARQIRIKAAA